MITASPEGTITTGQDQSVSLQCMLEGATPGGNIQYQWSKDGASVPSGVLTNGGRSLTDTREQWDLPCVPFRYTDCG